MLRFSDIKMDTAETPSLEEFSISVLKSSVLSAMIIICIIAINALYYIVTRLWKSFRNEIDMTIQLWKLDTRIVYHPETGSKWTLSSSIENSDKEESWKPSDYGMSHDTFDVLSMTILIIVALISVVCYGDVVGKTMFAQNSFQAYTENRGRIVSMLLLDLALLTIGYSLLAVLYCLSWRQFMYRVKWAASVDPSSSINLKMSYHHDTGFTFLLLPIVAVSTPTTTIDKDKAIDSMRKRIYDEIVRVQWRMLNKKYKLTQRFIRLIQCDVSDDCPLFKENVDKLALDGYNVVHRGASVCLLYNESDALRSKFVANQLQMIKIKYTATGECRQLTDISLDDVNDDENPLFEENIVTLEEQGFRVSYHDINDHTDNRVRRQTQLKFVYNPLDK